MPAMDGSGPLGKGPMTGRGQGMCIVSYEPDAAPWCRRHLRLGFAQGRGLGRRVAARITSRKELLKARKKALEEELDSISEELKSLSEDPKDY